MKGASLLFIINMFSGICYSLIAPLFPLLGKKDGLNEELIRWVISLYPITGTVFTPFVPLICQKFSRIKILMISTFVETTCTFLYGLFNYISSFPLLIITIFIVIILHGIFAGFIAILVFSLTYSLS